MKEMSETKCKHLVVCEVCKSREECRNKKLDGNSGCCNCPDYWGMIGCWCTRDTRVNCKRKERFEAATKVLGI